MNLLAHTTDIAHTPHEQIGLAFLAIGVILAGALFVLHSSRNN